MVVVGQLCLILKTKWLKDIVVTSSVRLELESDPSWHVNGVDVDERRNDIPAMVVDIDAIMIAVRCGTNRT